MNRRSRSVRGLDMAAPFAGVANHFDSAHIRAAAQRAHGSPKNEVLQDFGVRIGESGGGVPFDVLIFFRTQLAAGV